MRLVKPDVEEKGRIAGRAAFQPGNGFIDDELAGVALQFANRLSVSDKSLRIAVAWYGIVPSGEPVVEAVLVRGRFVAFGRWQAQVPFADVGGGVAGFFEDFRQSDLALQEMRVLGGVVDPTVDSGANMLTSRHQNGSGRRADRTAGVEIGEARPFRRQSVNGRGLHRSTVTSDVLPAEIVREQDDDIGLRGKDGGLGPEDRQGETDQKT